MSGIFSTNFRSITVLTDASVVLMAAEAALNGNALGGCADRQNEIERERTLDVQNDIGLDDRFETGL